MDGNLYPDVVLTTNAGVYLKASNTYKLYFADIASYAWLPMSRSIWFIKLFHQIRKSMLLKFGQVDPNSPVPGDQIKIYAATPLFAFPFYYLPPTYIMEGLWKRETGSLGQKRASYHCYNMRRIIDEQGQKLPVYDYFVKETEKRMQKEQVWDKGVFLYSAKKKN